VTAPIPHCSDQVKPLSRDAKRHPQGRGNLQPDTYGKDRSIPTSMWVRDLDVFGAQRLVS